MSPLMIENNEDKTYPQDQLAPAFDAGSWNRHAPILGSPVPLERPPALAVHNGKLWLLYVTKDLYLKYGYGTNESFEVMTDFGQGLKSRSGPALFDLGGTLHCVFSETDSSLVHYQYDDQTKTWGKRLGLGVNTNSDASLTTIDGNRLLCIYLKDGHSLYFSTWNASDGWSAPQTCNNESSWGCPGVFTLKVNGKPQASCIFASNSDARNLLSITYDSVANRWSRSSSQIAGERTAYGVKAASFNDEAFVSFQEREANGDVYVCFYKSGKWFNHEYVGDNSSDTPSLCAFNGVVNVMFNSRNSKTLSWYQRSLMDVDLSSWMAKMDANVYISNMCIPGTHDSAAINIWIPYVTCQTMSITSQLYSGIRYLDLRCQVKNGTLWMFHGDINLDQSLADVLNAIWDFLRKYPKEAIIAQIKDEASPHSPDFASKFYDLIDNQYKQLFALGTTTPTLKMIQGKIQLVRRFASGRDIGINVSGDTPDNDWKDNNPRFNISTPSGVQLTIQDEYTPGGDTFETVVRRKLGVVEALLLAANSDLNRSRWYINFTSAYADHIEYATPHQVALGRWPWEGLNSELDSWMRLQKIKARWGVVLFNFPESPHDLITRIVVSNTFATTSAAEVGTDLGESTVEVSKDPMERYAATLERFTETMERCSGLMEVYLKRFALE